MADVSTKMTWIKIQAHPNLKLFVPPIMLGKISYNFHIAKEIWMICTSWLKLDWEQLLFDFTGIKNQGILP